jgi:hypothetical protein
MSPSIASGAEQAVLDENGIVLHEVHSTTLLYIFNIAYFHIAVAHLS